MAAQPPRWALRFLQWTCQAAYLDELQGDLLELFHREVEQDGLRHARRRFGWRALLSPRWYRIPRFSQLQPTVMYKSHFKVAFRHARRHRFASLIQVLGLVLGLAAVFYIALFIRSESSFDQMHENRNELYRVLRVDPVSGERAHGTSSRHGESLLAEFPFLSMCRFGNDPVKMGAVRPELVEDFFWADSSFFELFTFDFLQGDPATCLDRVNSVVLTESLSRRLFGSREALGQSLPVKVYDGDQEFLMTVTGIVADPPRHTHIQFQALGSMANAEDLYANLVGQWGFSWVRTYIQVPADRMAEVEAGISRLIRNHVGEEPSPHFGMGFQAFNDVYLSSQDIRRNTFRGNIRNLRIFGAVGLLILLISLMNYVNLSTARAMTRAKEVGIRKTLGSRSGSIVSQFIVESVMFVLLSSVVAFLLMLSCLPFLNGLLDLDLSLKILHWTDGLVLLAALSFLGLLAGLLPSLAMARLPLFTDNNTAIAFKPGQWSWTRKLFVGTQYLITLVLLVATLVIYKQYHYLKHYDLGFQPEQLLHIAVDDRELQARLEVLKERITQLPGIAGVTATGEDLPSELNNTWDFDWNGSGLEDPALVEIVGVDQDYFEVIGIDFVEGRNFSSGYSVDSARSVILNQQAQRLTGRDDLLGQAVEIGGRERRVQGIVEDHHFTSLHSGIVPMAYFIVPPGFRVSPDNLLLRLQTKDLEPLLDQLASVWGEFSTDPFTYNFVDEAFAAAYAAERRFSGLISAFTFIAIAISIVGLFGLINFIVQRKRKEISIRRVLGAEQWHLLHLLGRDFLVVFGLAMILALPIAYRVIQLWLAAYTYRIEVNILLPALAVAICLGISTLVIYYHLRRAIRVNPSQALTTE